MKYTIIIISVIIATVIIVLVIRQSDFALPASSPSLSQSKDNKGQIYEIIAQNLKIPWEVIFLPSGELILIYLQALDGMFRPLVRRH